jgi:hypothetical protein
MMKAESLDRLRYVSGSLLRGPYSSMGVTLSIFDFNFIRVAAL